MSRPRPPVLLIGDTLGIGGSEGQFVEVARGLDRSRWDVDVTCIRAEGPLRARLEEAGVHPWSCGRGSFKSGRLLSAIHGLARYLRAGQVQIVHSFDFYSNVLGVSAARLARVPVVIGSQRDLGELRPQHLEWLQAIALRLADRVLVNSEAVATRLHRSRAARSGRISIIRNGVDLSRFAPAPEGCPERKNILVGTLANLRAYKGLRELVDAAQLLLRHVPEARFAIWGEGPLRPELEIKIRDLGLASVIRLHGATQEPEKALRQCDIFVLPSLSEASSNVVLEAMATGLAVVATRVGGTAALIEDEQSGLLVPPGKPQALADAILRLIVTPELKLRLGRNARVRALGEFGMPRMLERIEEMYRRSLGLDVGTVLDPRAVSPR